MRKKTNTLLAEINASIRKNKWTHLFPVVIAKGLENELLMDFKILTLLEKEFKSHAIIKFSDLGKMTVEHFLSWDRFGHKCFLLLCPLLVSIRDGTISRALPGTIHGFPQSLPKEMLDFPLDKLDLRFAGYVSSKFGVRTISEFLLALDAGTISSANFSRKDLEKVRHEVTKLSTGGMERYSRESPEVCLNSVETMTLVENSLDDRDRLMLNARLFSKCPDDFKTLEQVGTMLHVTRERARQLEADLARRLRHYKLLSSILAKTLSSLDWKNSIASYQDILGNPLFKEVAVSPKGIPSVAILLSKVYPAKFTLTHNAIMLHSER